jgi:hypothetical protein
MEDKRGDTLQLPLMADFATDPIPSKKSNEVPKRFLILSY